jgi:mannose-6-phosphate isomerase-like protein (cupin superfamily)
VRLGRDGMIAGKLWGTTETLLQTPMIEMSRITVVDGGYCSWHKHEHKANAFYVISGELRVEIEGANGIVDATTLGPAEMSIVPPCVFHRFVARGKVEALEVYYMGMLSEDIIRRDVGGVMRPS